MRNLQVSEPSLTKFSTFSKLAKEVWESGILTHNGPKVQELERKLKEKWNIPHLSLVTNGTVALEIAIKSLDLPLGSKIITTPYTWIATASSIIWSDYVPVFADIDPMTLTINPKSIRKLVDKNTSAILGVHVFSNPCDVVAIDKIATKYGLKVIYDGAHSVNVKFKGSDLSQYGDISTHSYHATKLYNCGEGGAIITKDPELAKKIERLRFFGHDENKNIVHKGTNGKMHEISACIGLANLTMMDKSMRWRKKLTSRYEELLTQEPLPIQFQKRKNTSYNFSYFPVIFGSEQDLLNAQENLKNIGVFARRYFYPSVNTMVSDQKCPISEDVSKRSLCLPCHDNVTLGDVEEICKIVSRSFIF